MTEISEKSTSLQTDKRGKAFKIILKTLAWTIGLWAILLIVLQIALSSSALTGIVNRMAVEYVEGDINFGNIRINMFRNFPRVSLIFDDFSITYPADRFDLEEISGAQGDLLYQGTGEISDTLVSFSRLAASLNLPALAAGKLDIHNLRLTKPRVFAHYYGEGKANWNMFRFAETEEEEDTTGLSLLPKISLGRISLAGKPHVVYTDSRDTLFAMVDIGRAAFEGSLSNRDQGKRQIGLTLDNILIAGRMASDTLALRLQQMYIHEHEDHMDVGIALNSTLMTKRYGRVELPVTLEGIVGLPEDSITTIQVSNMLATVAGVPIELDANIGLGRDKTYIEAMAEIPQWEIDLVLKEYVSLFIPEVEKFKTDATVSLLVACLGEYDHITGKLPSISASLSVPQAYISHSDVDSNVSVAFDANIYNDNENRIMAELSNANVSTAGLDLSASVSASDLIGKDPEFIVDGNLKASLDSLVRFIPDSLDIKMNGDIAAKISGTAKLSNLNMFSLAHADLLASINGDDIRFNMPKDTISAVLNGFEFNIAPEDMVSRSDSTKKFRMLGIEANIDKTDINYKEAMMLKGERIVLTAKNSATETGDSISKTPGRFGGSLIARNILFKDAAATSIELEESSTAFQMIPKKGNSLVPVLTLTSDNERINLNTEFNRVILADSKIKAEAAMNSIDRQKRRTEIIDSLTQIHPDIPEDSLLRMVRATRLGRTAAKEDNDDFKDMDFDFRLDETFARYFREWDLDGSVDVALGMIMTPYFPLENYIEDMSVAFNNNEIDIDNVTFEAGNSKMQGKGNVSGLKQALSGRRRSTSPISVKLDLNSDGIDGDELMAAYSTGMSFDPSTMKGKEDISNEDFFEHVITDSIAVDEKYGLLVIPSNIRADLTLKASDIKYSDIEIDSAAAKITARDRCIQITDTKAGTNLGDISLEGFYATRSKKDIKAGFDFRFKDITADKVIKLVPAMDTAIPMLKSFKGMLDCEIAATAALDTLMNIMPESINGVVRIGGRNMTVTNDEDFKKLAEMLKFKDVSKGSIDMMTVEGIIKDNKLEVFPFVIQMDRYTMALSGVQNLDMSFRYHVSMIKSPMLFRFGVDLYGQDFDNFRFKVGKAKYKSVEVPEFSAEIDETRTGLVTSIRNIFETGVDKAIADHQKQEAIAEHKKDIGYVEAVDMEMEELSEIQRTIIQGE